MRPRSDNLRGARTASKSSWTSFRHESIALRRWCSIVVSVAFLCAAPSSFAETIYLKGGRKIEAKILERTDRSVIVDWYGVRLTYWMDDIVSIDGKAPGPERSSQASNVGPPSSSPAEAVARLERPHSTTIMPPEQLFTQVAPAVVVIRGTAQGRPFVGSGFLIEARGVLVTNCHVALAGTIDQIRLKDGRTLNLQGMLSYDPYVDLCVLQVTGEGLPVVTLDSSEILREGQQLFTIGAPLGFEYTISNGPFSGRRVRDSAGHSLLQFSAPISPGNSGGPLINASGAVVGVVTFFMQGGQNLNLAIPSTDVSRVLGRKSKFVSLSEFPRLQRAYNVLVQAEQEEQKKSISSAMRYFSEALALDPTLESAWLELASFDLLQGRFDAGVEKCQNALGINVRDAYAHIVLATLYVEQGKVDMAEREYKAAIEINPTYELAHRLIGILYRDTAHWEEAIAAFKEAIQLNPAGPEAYVGLGQSYVRAGAFGDAIAALQQAVSLGYQDLSARVWLARALRESGRFAEAASEYERVLVGHPQDGEAHLGLAMVYAKVGEREAARKHLEQAQRFGLENAPEVAVILEQLKREKQK